MKMHRIVIRAALLILTTFGNQVWAGGVIIVHKSNTATINKADIQKVFLGKIATFSDGKQAIPINHTDDSELRKLFEKIIIKKRPDQMKAYWAKTVFTGKGFPPKTMNPDKIKQLVAENPALLGYVDISEVDDSVKVILSFDSE